MLLGLTSLFSTAFRRQKSPTKRHLRRGRRLLGEQLETRYALAGDLVLPEEPLPGGSQDAPPADESTPSPGDAQVDPSESDSGEENAAPWISDFTFVNEGNWITIRGFVTDDEDPTGYIVEIAGVVNFELTVDDDDWFSYRFAVTPEHTGTISAQTRDFLGLLSNIVSITL